VGTVFNLPDLAWSFKTHTTPQPTVRVQGTSMSLPIPGPYDRVSHDVYVQFDSPYVGTVVLNKQTAPPLHLNSLIINLSHYFLMHCER
jgi:hypothetical protein